MRAIDTVGDELFSATPTMLRVANHGRDWWEGFSFLSAGVYCQGGVMKSLIVVLLSVCIAQGQAQKLSDDYAKAALRIVYFHILRGSARDEWELEKQTDLYVDAEAQVVNDAEEQSLKDISLIMEHYPQISIPCSKDLTSALRHREGTPESCKEYTKR